MAAAPDLPAVRAALSAAGLDVMLAFDLRAALEVAGVDAATVPTLGRARPLALLVGNSRALWPIAAPVLASDRLPHPLDRYVERHVDAARASAGGPTEVVFGHTADERGFVPLQRIAAAAGLGRLAPSHLLVHHALGPWLALRAIIVFDADATAATCQPLPQPSPCDCARQCEVALVHAQQARGADAWRAWLAVRDACPIGRDARYSDEQIAFHYGGLDALVRRAAARERGPIPTLD